MRVGMVAYATEQGLGYLAKSFYDAGVVQDVLVIHHGKRPTLPEWYGDDGVPITQFPIAPRPGVREVLDRCDVMLFFETAFDWEFPAVCNSHSVTTVMMPMYEWFPKGRKEVFDGYLCPSLLDVQHFGGPYFHPPVDPSTWQLHTKAERFVHNAGNVGHRWHKGTEEVLRAMEFVESDLLLTVRCQDVVEMSKVLQRVPQAKRNPRIDLQPGAIPYGELFKHHDVMVTPEKFNGMSLPLQEAFAAGLLVMTTDRFPMNTWLPNAPLIPVERTRRTYITPQYLEIEESIVSPRAIAATMDEWFGRDITEMSLRGKEWAEANSWTIQHDRCLALLQNIVDATRQAA